MLRSSPLTIAVCVWMLLSALAGPAQSEDTEFDWSLRFRPRAETFHNRQFELQPEQLNTRLSDQLDHITQQTRLTLDAHRGALSGRLQLQHHAAFGTTGGEALTDPPLEVHQAFLAAWLLEDLQLLVGRQELAFGRQRVLGAVGWSQVGRAWDGLRLKVGYDTDTHIDFFLAQYAEGAVERPDTYSGDLFDEDAWLSGIYLTHEGLFEPFIEKADLYLIDDLRFEAPAADGGRIQSRRHLLTFGARLAGEWSSIDAEVEGAFQLGSACVALDTSTCTTGRLDVQAGFVDAEAGIKPHERFRLFLGAGLATGDDPTTASIESYDHLYPTAHAFLGLMDMIGARTNVRELRGGVSLKFDKLRLLLSFHDFTRLQPVKERVGLEIDTMAWFDLGEGFVFLVGHGAFIPEEGASSDASDPGGAAQWFVAQLQLTL